MGRRGRSERAVGYCREFAIETVRQGDWAATLNFVELGPHLRGAGLLVVLSDELEPARLHDARDVVEHVGDHWTAHEDGHRGTVKPTKEHAKFYEPYSKRVPPEYSGRPILGWFEL